jgi:hypothetical protein
VKKQKKKGVRYCGFAPQWSSLTEYLNVGEIQKDLEKLKIFKSMFFILGNIFTKTQGVNMSQRVNPYKLDTWETTKKASRGNNKIL